MISACMTVSVRELRTAVREWACCQYLNFIQCNKKAQISRSKTYQCNFQQRLYGSKVRSSGTATKITNVVLRCSLIKFYPESGNQNNMCNTVNICEHGTNQQV